MLSEWDVMLMRDPYLNLASFESRFALLVMPEFLDPKDEESCPFILPNKKPMSWQWLNTVNRVNTQVKKVGYLRDSNVVIGS